MRKLGRSAALLILLLVPSVLLADHYASLYVIPVVGRTAGVNGTNWMSDVAIQNFSSTDMIVDLLFIESGQNRADNVFAVLPNNADVVVPAGGSVLLKDVLNNVRPGQNNVTGSMIVGSDRPFAVTSRSYSVSPTGLTVGQTVLPVRNFLDNAVGTTNNAMAVAYIPGLINNARFRTNLGFTAASGDLGTPMVIRFIIRNATGQEVSRRDFTVPQGLFTHVQFSLLDTNLPTGVTNRNFDIGSATVQIVSGSGAVAPYASVIDNVTADAVYVNGVFPENTPLPKKGAESLFHQLWQNTFRR